jgi:transposase InsO family protein
VNVKWCGDLTEIPTDEGKLYLATVEDLASRRIVGFGLSGHHDAEVATAALKMAVAVRGGDLAGVIFHSDRGSGEYTAGLFEAACSSSQVTQSMGRAGSCFDNAAAESWFSTLEWELLRTTHFETKKAARREVAWFIDWYNRARRHSSCEMKPPIAYEAILAARAAETVTDGEAA